MKTRINSLIAIALTAIISQSCVHSTPEASTNTNIEKTDSLSNDSSFFSVNMEKKSIENGKANFIIAKIEFPAGKIMVNPGNSNILNSRFICTNKEWEPEISYIETVDTGKITIKPKKDIDNINFKKSDTCHWYVDFNPEKKYDFDIQMGAGKGDLNLEGLMIQNFNLELGAGKANINLKNTSVHNVDISVGAGKATLFLTGTWNNNLKAKIAGGVGEIEVHLPKEVGVIAEVNGLLGDVEAEGFSKVVNTFSNKGKTKYTLNLEIDGAIGKVKLILE